MTAIVKSTSSLVQHMGGLMRKTLPCRPVCERGQMADGSRASWWEEEGGGKSGQKKQWAVRSAVIEDSRAEGSNGSTEVSGMHQQRQRQGQREGASNAP